MGLISRTHGLMGLTGHTEIKTKERIIVEGLRSAKLLAIGLLWIVMLITGYLGSFGWFDQINTDQIRLQRVDRLLR